MGTVWVFVCGAAYEGIRRIDVCATRRIAMEYLRRYTGERHGDYTSKDREGYDVYKVDQWGSWVGIYSTVPLSERREEQ